MKKLTTITIALLFATGSAYAQNNDASTTQTGDDNDALVEQVGISNVADVSQDGDNNEATVQQGEFGANNVQSNYAEASISQVGSENEAAVNQRQGWSGGSAVSIHSIEQDGLRNTGLLTTFNGGNEGSVTQLGNDNYANGRQAGSGHDLDIYQEGSDNEARINQLSGASGNSADIAQRGSDNYGLVEQSSTSGNRAGQWVAGDDNTVIQTQTSDDNRQRVEITGDSNTYTTLQEGGSGNALYINSRGTGPGSNSSFAYNSDFDAVQSGSGNLISGEMSGYNNSLTITQFGGGNSVGSGMWDADGFRVEGDNNVGLIDQSGSGHSASMTILGNGNTATISQSN